MSLAGAQEQARLLLRQAGGRTTQPRQQVLAALLAAPGPLSHQDVQAQIEPLLDRVTVYRVLEWLTEAGLAHKLAGDDRVWRFASAAALPHRHAHFHCTDCGRFYCLEQFSTELPAALPAGFIASGPEITIKGQCAACRGLD